MGELRLREIWIYPVKALGGIRCSSSRVMEKGLEHDRRWMLVDENGVFMTQRIHPTLALFNVSITGPALHVTYNGTEIQVPIAPPQGGAVINAGIWDDFVEVVEIDPRISAWFAEQLNSPCRLVAFPEENERPVDKAFQVNRENVSLADAYPFLIIGDESLADLNRRMANPLPMNRFRPNLVFSGGKPFEEDDWKNFRIGRNRFIGVKPCSRCAVPTINQETAEKGVEPLATLAKFRKQGSKTLFGQNVIAVDHDKIFEGDEIIME